VIVNLTLSMGVQTASGDEHVLVGVGKALLEFLDGLLHLTWAEAFDPFALKAPDLAF
jgi:hypothetical protein